MAPMKDGTKVGTKVAGLEERLVVGKVGYSARRWAGSLVGK